MERDLRKYILTEAITRRLEKKVFKGEFFFEKISVFEKICVFEKIYFWMDKQGRMRWKVLNHKFWKLLMVS